MNGDDDAGTVDEYQPVPAAVIRTKVDGLDGPVTTQQIVDHLNHNDASLDELATVAALPDRRWSDYNAALAAASSGFTPRSTKRQITTQPGTTE